MCAARVYLRPTLLTWLRLVFNRENWRTMTTSCHLGSRAGVTATLPGIYPPHAHQIHFGFALHGALLLNALGKYSALCEVYVLKVWSQFATLCSFSFSLNWQNWDSWVWCEGNECEEDILGVWVHEQGETLQIIPFFMKKSKLESCDSTDIVRGESTVKVNVIMENLEISAERRARKHAKGTRLWCKSRLERC